MNQNKKEVLGGVFWKFSERILAQFVSTIVAIVLARLLSPGEYGMISMVTVFITIANVFVVSGFGTALIQKQDADNIDFSTVFYFTLLFSAAVYLFLWFFSIPVSLFYNMPELKPVLRVLAVSIPIMGINSVQQAYVSRKMIFRKFFYATLFGTLISAAVGITMAYCGFGVWALVAQSLTNNVIDTLILQLSIDWKPIRVFSVRRLKGLFRYGWKLLLQSLILNLYSSLRSLLIGKFYTAEDLAYYTKGIRYPDLICSNIDTALNSVLFPAMSREQAAIERIKSMARRTTRISSYVLNPVLIGFIVIAEPFISILLTDKWLPAAPYLRIMCIVLLFRAPQTAILQAIKAVGRSDAILKADVPIRIFALIILVVSVKYGVIFVALSEIITTIVGSVFYMVVAKRIINYSPLEICSDFLWNTALSVWMGAAVWFAKYFWQLPNSTILIQILIGAAVYIMLSHFTGNESYHYIIQTGKEMLPSRKHRNGKKE